MTGEEAYFAFVFAQFMGITLGLLCAIFFKWINIT